MRCVLLAGLVACLVPGLAHASITTYNDQASFNAAAPGATQYTVSGPATNYGTSYTLGPATFTSSSANVFDDGSYGTGVQYAEFYPSQVFVTLSPSFSAIGLTLGTYGGTDTIDISLNAVPVTTVTSAGSYPATFYIGFIDSDPITSLTLFDRTEGRQIDLLNFAVADTGTGGTVPLPEPASLLMLCVGTLMALTARRRAA